MDDVVARCVDLRKPSGKPAFCETTAVIDADKGS
jgi:hypothetical protein